MLLIILIILVVALAIACIGRWAVKRYPPSLRLHHSDLIKVVLSLDERTLDDLFDLYGKEFGPGAARYARRTYSKWRSGKVRPSKKTFNRLLVYLPRVMSFDLKCEVLRKLREEYCSKDNYKLTVDTQNWREPLAPLIAGIINKAYTAELPKPVQDRLGWLADHDVQIAYAIIAHSQAEASKNAVSLLEQEIYNIERLLEADSRSKITHTIKLPYGTVALKIKRR